MKGKLLNILVIAILTGIVVLISQVVVSTENLSEIDKIQQQIYIPGSLTPPAEKELRAMENAPIGKPLAGIPVNHWLSLYPRDLQYFSETITKTSTPTP